MKYFARILALVLALCLLVGCDRSAARSYPTPLPRPEGEAPAATVELTDPGGYEGFGANLLRASRKEGENTLISPLSVALALGMTANGAQGETLTQFETVFGMDRESWNTLCAEMMKVCKGLGGSTQANLVNSLWADPEVTLQDDFLRRCMDLYDAQVFCQDLHTPKAAEAVNGWVKEATRGMIPAIVDRFNSETVLALINAVYLKNQFERPFVTPSFPWTMDFTTADGTVSQPEGMSNGTRSETYLVGENGQGVVLPYDDGQLGLLLMLPDEGVSLTDYLNGWTEGTTKALLDNGREAQVALSVPKFKAEWSGSLVEALAAMGLTDAFTEKADFGAMGTAQGYPLYIGSVIHKTAFEVNEKGTEAAAVTMAAMDCAAAMPPDDLIYLTFDRPFVYGIVDLQTGLPLFLGTLERL